MKDYSQDRFEGCLLDQAWRGGATGTTGTTVELYRRAVFEPLIDKVGGKFRLLTMAGWAGFSELNQPMFPLRHDISCVTIHT